MPTPRMTTSFRPANETTFARQSSVLAKAVIMGTISDAANSYFINMGNGITRASSSMDAPIQVGDVVYVQSSEKGWLITGTA